MVVPLRWLNPPTTAFILQDNITPQYFLSDWSTWENLGTASPLAVVASEDQLFANHFGFDLQSIRRSIEDHADGASLRGASTITQQVAKNLYLWSGRSFLRKGIEAYFTVLIETTLSKKRILEIYLNVAEFGPGIYGVGAASDAYFGKTPSELTNAEAALLAAALPNPKQLQVAKPSPYVLERQSWILQQMQRLQRERWITLLQ
jgi:monofunctional biosynthetic peptidoglycan transglycosylase